MNEEGLWEMIETKARKQEDVDDNWVLIRLDLNKPMWSGRAEYELVNIVSRESKSGSLYSWRED